MKSQPLTQKGGLPALIVRRNLVSDVVQGVIAGGVLAFLASTLIINLEWGAIQSTANGWTTTMQCGVPGSKMLVQAACARNLPAVNLPAEAVYWTTTVDRSGHTLSGQHRYKLHFPAGGVPPNTGFWSLTMTDAKRVLVANSIARYSLGDRSGLASNADGSIDIYIQASEPAGHASNWLPAPPGDFMLWLRVYQPDEAVLKGGYEPPPIEQVP